MIRLGGLSSIAASIMMKWPCSIGKIDPNRSAVQFSVVHGLQGLCCHINGIIIHECKPFRAASLPIKDKIYFMDRSKFGKLFSQTIVGRHGRKAKYANDRVWRCYWAVGLWPALSRVIIAARITAIMRRMEFRISIETVVAHRIIFIHRRRRSLCVAG